MKTAAAQPGSTAASEGWLPALVPERPPLPLASACALAVLLLLVTCARGRRHKRVVGPALAQAGTAVDAAPAPQAAGWPQAPAAAAGTCSEAADTSGKLVITTVADAVFNGAHCEAGLDMDAGQADAHLLANADAYAGYVTLEPYPGKVFFARIGAALFAPPTAPSPGCTARVLASQDVRGGAEPALASARTQYVPPGRADFLPKFRLFSDDGSTRESRRARTPTQPSALRAAVTREPVRRPGATDCIECGVGSCWLIGALASLAELESAPLRGLCSARGAQFDVRLCCDGTWRTFTVDAALPACAGPAGFSAAYAKPSPADCCIWPCVLEKAYATSGINRPTSHGYPSLNGGDPAAALRALTGATVEVVETASLSKAALDAWLEAHVPRRDVAVCAASAIFESRAMSDIVASGGVQQDHCYSIHGVRNGAAEAAEGGSALEVELRNPWGRRGLAQPGQPLRDDTDGLFWVPSADIAALFAQLFAVSLS